MCGWRLNNYVGLLKAKLGEEFQRAAEDHMFTG
jgi:hypothetical protein